MDGIWAIIQARTGSSRLPRKVLSDIAGRPMLARVIDRARASRKLDGVLVATTLSSADDPLEQLCKSLLCPVFRGSESDVLDRYYGAARHVDAGVVVRLTADCPLLDPQVIDYVVERFFAEGADYASNTLEPRTFPRGLDTEVLRRSCLEVAALEARDPEEREHVTPFVWRRPERFSVVRVAEPDDQSSHRWTVDTSDDLKFVRRIYSEFGSEVRTAWREVLALLQAHPDWGTMNRHVRQREVR